MLIGQLPRHMAIVGAALLVACSDDNMMDGVDDSITEDGVGATTDVEVPNPDTARSPVMDRFSTAPGMLQVREASNGLPGPDEAVDFDQSPFITRGLGPEGQSVRNYNFDVQATRPAPIYALFREGEDSPVAGQLNIVDVIPGAAGYNDFARARQREHLE